MIGCILSKGGTVHDEHVLLIFIFSFFEELTHYGGILRGSSLETSDV